MGIPSSSITFQLSGFTTSPGFVVTCTVRCNLEASLQRVGSWAPAHWPWGRCLLEPL